MRSSSMLCALLCFTACGGGSGPRTAKPADRPTGRGPGPEALRPKFDALVQPAIDGNWAVGVVVGLVDTRGSAVFGYGRLDAQHAEPPGEETVFEIGSVTKAFTGLLLAELLGQRQVSLHDPVQKLLPPFVKVPTRSGKVITLGQLATHTSGLPRLPDNMAPADMANPYADYTVEQLYEFLGKHQLRRDPGEAYEYSNVGYGLLGHVLALQQKRPLDELLVERIATPLGMTSTRVALDDALRARLAPGHDGDGNPVPPWDNPTLGGATALRSTASDLLQFVRANLGMADTPLRNAILLTHESRFPTAVPRGKVSLGWHISADGRTVWQSGSTGGHRAWIGFDRGRQIGVVVLANTNTDLLDQIGERAIKLLGNLPAEPLELRGVLTLDPAVLDSFVGKYKLTAGLVITISRDGDLLYIQATGAPRSRLYPSGPGVFYLRTVATDVVFATDSGGKVTGLVLRQEGSELRATRLR